MVTFVAVPYQLYSLTGSTLQVGLLSICDAVPLLLFSAIGGTIADRLDRRKLVFRADIGLLVVSGLLAVNAFSGDPQVWALYVLAAAATSLWAIGAPALRALMPGLVPHEQLAASQALQSIYSNTGAIVGPCPRRPADRGRRCRHDLRDRHGELRRVARRRVPDRAGAAAGGRGGGDARVACARAGGSSSGRR